MIFENRICQFLLICQCHSKIKVTQDLHLFHLPVFWSRPCIGQPQRHVRAAKVLKWRSSGNLAQIFRLSLVCSSSRLLSSIHLLTYTLYFLQFKILSMLLHLCASLPEVFLIPNVPSIRLFNFQPWIHNHTINKPSGCSTFHCVTKLCEHKHSTNTKGYMQRGTYAYESKTYIYFLI